MSLYWICFFISIGVTVGIPIAIYIVKGYNILDDVEKRLNIEGQDLIILIVVYVVLSIILSFVLIGVGLGIVLLIAYLFK